MPFNQGENLVVHIFSAFTPDVAQYHGKVLGPDRFRGPSNLQGLRSGQESRGNVRKILAIGKRELRTARLETRRVAVQPPHVTQSCRGGASHYKRYETKLTSVLDKQSQSRLE